MWRQLVAFAVAGVSVVVANAQREIKDPSNLAQKILWNSLTGQRNALGDQQNALETQKQVEYEAYAEVFGPAVAGQIKIDRVVTLSKENIQTRNALIDLLKENKTPEAQMMRQSLADANQWEIGLATLQEQLVKLAEQDKAELTFSERFALMNRMGTIRNQALLLQSQVKQSEADFQNAALGERANIRKQKIDEDALRSRVNRLQ